MADNTTPKASWRYIRGKHQFRFRLPDGSRPSVAFEGPNSPQGKRRAEEKLAAYFERGIVAKLLAANAKRKENSGDLGAGRATVSRIADQWLRLVERSDLAPATKKGHAAHVENHIARKFGDREPHTLTTGELRGWIRELHEGKSAARARNVFFTLSKLLEDANAENWIECANPCRHPKVREALPPIHVPDDDEKAQHTEAEARQLIVSCQPYQALLYAIAYTTGARYGEIMGLRFGTVAEKEGVLCYHFTKALAKHGDEGPNTLRATKTRGSKRWTPVHPAVATMLEAWRSTWAERVGREPTDDDFLFADENGAAWRGRAAHLMRVDLEAAGMPTEQNGTAYRFHSTRSSLQQWLEGRDCPSIVIDRIVGHVSDTVRGKHYTKGNLVQMLRWLSTIDVDTTGGHAPAIGSLPLDAETEAAEIHAGILQNAAKRGAVRELTNRRQKGPIPLPRTTNDADSDTGVPSAPEACPPPVSTEQALAQALAAATVAREWALVGELARQLEARRVEATVNVDNVVALPVKRRG